MALEFFTTRVLQKKYTRLSGNIFYNIRLKNQVAPRILYYFFIFGISVYLKLHIGLWFKEIGHEYEDILTFCNNLYLRNINHKYGCCAKA
jgi:hypothetical protein